MVYGRAAVVFAVSNEGYHIIGRASAWPSQEFNADFLVYRARGNAHRKLRRSRERQAAYLAYKAEKRAAEGTGDLGRQLQAAE